MSLVSFSGKAYFVLSSLVLIQGLASRSGVRERVCGLAMGPLASCPLELVRDLGNA